MTIKNKKYVGYIEGYYGRLLSWGERFCLLSHLRKESLNTYFYAPKEDPLHRVLWRTRYSREWLTAFKDFVYTAKKKKISVVPGMSPGLSFDYLSPNDYSTLLEKFTSFLDAGVKTVVLLMDDIPDSLPLRCGKKFGSLGEAHGHLLSRIYNDLQKNASRPGLWFCPTVYSDQSAGNDIENSRYLLDLKKSMPGEIPILWTGPNIVSAELSRATIKKISGLFNENIIIWDNLYANDYCPCRIFTGPFFGRKKEIVNITIGILLNPTGLFHTDAFLTSLLGEFLKKKSPAQAWQNVADGFCIPREYRAVRQFFESPFRALSPDELSTARIKKYRSALKKLIFEWKSPLHREWYPFLYQLDLDLRLIGRSRNRNSFQWINKKYPPALAHALTSK